MCDNAKNAAYHAAENKYYRDRNALTRLWGVWNCSEWIAEKKGGAYVATELKSGFSVWAKSQRELVETFRAMGVRCDRVKKVGCW